MLDWCDRVGSYCVESLWSGAVVLDRYGLVIGGLSCWIVSAGLATICIGLLWWQPCVNKQGMPFLTGGGYIMQTSGKMLSICFNFCLNRQVAYMKVIRKHYSDYLRILAFCR